MTYEIWYAICEIRYLIFDIWDMTSDIWNMIDIHQICVIYFNNSSIHIPSGVLRVRVYMSSSNVWLFNLCICWFHFIFYLQWWLVSVHPGRKREIQGYFHHLVGQPSHLQKLWGHPDLSAGGTPTSSWLLHDPPVVHTFSVQSPVARWEPE